MAPTQTIDGEPEINLTFTSKDVTIIIESLIQRSKWYQLCGFPIMESKTHDLIEKIEEVVNG